MWIASAFYYNQSCRSIDSFENVLPPCKGSRRGHAKIQSLHVETDCFKCIQNKLQFVSLCVHSAFSVIFRDSWLMHIRATQSLAALLLLLPVSIWAHQFKDMQGYLGKINPSQLSTKSLCWESRVIISKKTKPSLQIPTSVLVRIQGNFIWAVLGNFQVNIQCC